MLNLIYNIIPQNPKDAERLFNGRGGSVSLYNYINIDYFPPVILLTFYREPADDVISEIQNKLLSNLNLNIKSILLQKRYLPKSPIELLYGSNVDDHICEENNLKFSINFAKNQNIGFFIDMKLGRELLQKYAMDKKILNLFSYTCAFSTVAIKYGAVQVVNLDLAKPALARGKENHLLNGIDSKIAKFYAHDILKSFGLLKRLAPFDFVIIDPPSDHGSNFLIERDYPKLLARVKDWTTPDAFIMTCLNSPFYSFQYLVDCVRKYAPDLILHEKMGAPPSFMETDPDRGLKIILWRRGE